MDAFLRIEVELVGDSYSITFMRGADRKQRVGPFFALRARIAELRSDLADRLDANMVSVLQSDERVGLTDWTKINTAVRKLDSIGRAVLQAVLGSRGTVEVSEFLRNEVSFVQKGFRYSRATAAPTIELHTCLDPRRREEFSELIPIEFLPLFGPPDIPTVVDCASLVRAMARFVGMFATVRRSGLWEVDQRASIDGRGGLRTKVFLHHGQDNTEWEEKSFRKLQRRRLVDMDDPWPPRTWHLNGVSKTAGEDRMIEALFDQCRTSDGTPSKMADQIQHVFCHAETTGDRFDQHCLLLMEPAGDGQDPDQFYELKLETMLHALSRRLQSAAPVPRDALLFLNGCATARVGSRCLASFPGLFLQTHSGLIAVEAKIPTNVAALFSRLFYRNLFDGFDIGQSLFHAKWQLIQRFNNPLGILYTLYAKPDLYVTRRT